MNSPAIVDPRWTGRAATLALLLLAAWLAAAAWLVNVEYGDGYSVVANSEYLLGTSDAWFWQRGPLMSLLLVPAEWLAQRLALAPLDVRPHHAMMAALHLGYLVGVWRVLVAYHGRTPATLIGWLAAVPTVLFFSYAPFISHDILPGLLVLSMLWISQRFPDKQSASGFGLFFVLATTLVLIKQTYAVVPVAILVARLGALLSTRGLDARELRAGLLLAGATLLAGALCWVLYAALSSARFPDIPFLLRPLALIDKIGNNYDGLGELSEIFYPWVYLRNLSAYGILAMTLVLPGMVLAWRRGDSGSRQLALSWVLLLAAMQWAPFKEVRYLGFLAPLTACLVIPAIALALQRGALYRALLALVLLVDLARVVPEATRIADPYYRDGVTAFFEPLVREQHSDVPIFFGKGWLSFISPEPRAFVGDAFHRIVEMQIEQIRVLHDLPRERVFRVELASVAAAAQVQAGSLFLMQNHLLSRAAPFSSDSRAGLPHDYEQVLARTADVGFRLENGRYVAQVAPQTSLMLLRAGADGTATARVRGSTDPAMLRYFAGFEGTPEQVSLRVLVILRECDLGGCRRISD